MKSILTVVAISMMVLFPRPASAVTIHVPADEPTIQAGIDAAAMGDVVLVAPDTYMENIDFGGKAITVRSEAGAAATAIDGGQAGTVVNFQSNETGASILDGFTITNGSGVDYGGTRYGGGILCVGANPMIQNCTLSANSADHGGGLFCFRASPSLSGCLVVDNNALGMGGGIVCNEGGPSVAGSILSGNSAQSAGGVLSIASSPTIISSVVSDNTAVDFGGGIFCHSGSPTIERCTVSANTSGLHGGGIACQASALTVTDTIVYGNTAASYGGGVIVFESPSAIIEGSILRGNTAQAQGGGGICCIGSSMAIVDSALIENSTDNNAGGIFVYDASPAITNCIFSQNRSDRYGGGMYCWKGEPEVTNCTFSGNSAGYRGGGISTYRSSLTVRNTILYGDTAPSGKEIYLGYPSTAVVEYSDVQWGWSGTGNINANPDFAGDAHFHLSPGSPCIDAGTDAGVYHDREGDARPHFSGFDMGADEYTGECWDLDEDGFADALCGGFDCDDQDPAAYPGAAEVCDGADTDCNGEIPLEEADNDGDGWMLCDGDCDDSLSYVHPEAAEQCNHIDDDCDEAIDEGLSTYTFYEDADGDGHGNPGVTVTDCMTPPGYVPAATDCDDTDPDVNPGVPEGPYADPSCADGIDNNCDGVVDMEGIDCYCWDADNDGHYDDACGGDDCSDEDASTHPGAQEICDHLDNDCDEAIDEDLPTYLFYRDVDGDGYGDPGLSAEDCTEPEGYVGNNEDCDDSRPEINPEAMEGPFGDESCADGLDNDCDGLVGEADPGCDLCYGFPGGDHDFQVVQVEEHCLANPLLSLAVKLFFYGLDFSFMMPVWVPSYTALEEGVVVPIFGGEVYAEFGETFEIDTGYGVVEYRVDAGEDRCIVIDITGPIEFDLSYILEGWDCLITIEGFTGYLEPLETGELQLGVTAHIGEMSGACPASNGPGCTVGAVVMGAAYFDGMDP